MNTVAIKGYIRDIEFSHDVGEIEYDKATVVCPGVNGKEDDLFLIRFKKFCNKYKEGDLIEFKGNLRSYSIKDGDKSNVQIYIFTYFDLPDIVCGDVNIDGRICKIDELRTTKSGKNYIHFILANNIFTKSSKINSYIPCTAYGEVAEKLSNNKVNDFLNIKGEFHSHEFKKRLDSGEIEFRVAHEVIVKEFDVVE